METQPNPISSFSPTPAQAEYIIHSITSRDTTLAHIGAHFSITVETLACWLSSPTIRARLEAADSTTCHHIRIRANVLTPLVLSAAAKLLEDFIDPPAPTPTRNSIDPALLALRRAETARKAAALIVRLTNHQPAHIRRAASTATHAPADNARATIAPALSDQAPAIASIAPAPDACENIAPSTSAHPCDTSPDASRAPTEIPASIAPTTPEPSTSVEHVLDLIATLSPEQIAELTALTTPLDSNAHLALTAEDSS